jgi:hypothetical protein
MSWNCKRSWRRSWTGEMMSKILTSTCSIMHYKILDSQMFCTISTETVFSSNSFSFLFHFICLSVFSHIVFSIMLCNLIHCLVFPAYEMISVTFSVRYISVTDNYCTSVINKSAWQQGFPVCRKSLLRQLAVGK